jgi:transposase
MRDDPKSPTGASKYSSSTCERAVRLVLETSEKFPKEADCLRHVCGQFGMHVGTLRRWVRETRAEAGEAVPYMDWKDHRIEQLERDKAELEQTIEVLKAATSFFARACDPQLPAQVSSASSSRPTENGSGSHRSAGR